MMRLKSLDAWALALPLRRSILRGAVCLLGLSVFPVYAQVDPDQLLKVQQQWAHAHYQIKDEDQQIAALNQLHQRIKTYEEAQPEAPEWAIWSAITLSTEAGIKGGLGALSLVKDARAALEKAIQLDGHALQGSAYTSLGALYYQVPGWPIGFGDDDQAKTLLQKGLALNPKGIDALYFWGDYLYDQGENEQAKQVFQHALEAPERPNRPIADAGRRREIQQKLADIEDDS